MKVQMPVPGEPTPRSGRETGSPVGFEALVARERSAMVRLAALVLGSGAGAEDAVQDAFAIVSTRWETLENPGGYLRTTVINQCRMALRRRAVEQRHAADLCLSADSPVEIIELRDALAKLSDRQRLVIVLRYFLDLGDDEAAAIVSCSPATVRSIAHRAIRRLRKELA